MKNAICFALDGMTRNRAAWFVDALEEHVGAFKVGLELFIRARWIPVTPRPIVLDLKLYDIPETVAGAVRAAGDLGVKYATIHIQQRAALEAAVRAAEPFGITLLGVTVLTSMTADDFADLGFATWSALDDPSSRVFNLATFAVRQCGLRGLVCSPREVGLLRGNLIERPFLLVPGVRSPGAATHYQARTGTPAQAVKDGADLIVVGRQIRDATNPVVEARRIAAEIEE